ncbi:hypothetical protein BV25DRAFT_1735399 [Artomyces pyxidatus]|uniref:Uncharacterized protein n=1 Tax=Artomyces pyxidatus TaxID=48021 RepID=A0ACB8SIE8_9AGAM|nr:hypothetical protein BV25DRAFT_1735399 [Artomyces pyxidatus]
MRDASAAEHSTTQLHELYISLDGRASGAPIAERESSCAGGTDGGHENGKTKCQRSGGCQVLTTSSCITDRGCFRSEVSARKRNTPPSIRKDTCSNSCWINAASQQDCQLTPFCGKTRTGRLDMEQVRLRACASGTAYFWKICSTQILCCLDTDNEITRIAVLSNHKMESDTDNRLDDVCTGR